MHVTLPTSVENQPDTGPGPRDSRPGILVGATALYGAMLLAALIWSAIGGLDLNLFGGSIPYSMIAGVAGASGLLALGGIAALILPAARRLADEMAGLLVDDSGPLILLAIALLSGVCEEVFFRGVIQQEFGLVIASVVFGAVHFVPERRFLLWTAYAIVAGFFLGWLYTATGGLAAPVTAHFLNNAFVLLYWKYRRRGRRAAT